MKAVKLRDNGRAKSATGRRYKPTSIIRFLSVKNRVWPKYEFDHTHKIGPV